MLRAKLISTGKLLCSVGLFLVPTLAVRAATMTYTATLSGATETPTPNNSPASGSATLTLNGNLLTVNIAFAGLVGGPASAAHIHCCAPQGTSAAVVVPFSAFPAATSGTYTNTFDLSIFVFSGGGSESALIAGFNSGQTYVNIHDAVYPGGEIQGQVFAAAATPEPSSLALLGTGLGGLLTVARRRFVR